MITIKPNVKEKAMKKLVIIVELVLMVNAMATAQDDVGGTTGHPPFSHAHSTSCQSSTGGVCYGYAMGYAAGAGSGDYYACDKATIIPPNQCSNWQTWSVDGTYWEEISDASLTDVPPGSVIKFAGHVSYSPQGITSSSTSATLYHIPNEGGTPTTGTMNKVNGQWKLIMAGGTYHAVGYYRGRSFNVKAQNLFYNGTNTVTNQGTITIAGTSGTSPVTVSRVWGGYTATAQSEHNYPTGYKQIFNSVWKRNGVVWGTTPQVNVIVRPLFYTYEAQYYQATAVTLIPVGGGGIYVDGETRYTSYTKYAQINPLPVEQVIAAANGTEVNRIQYNFGYWTNSANSDTSFSNPISFYPTTAVTYTAYFVPKPLPPTNIVVGAPVGQHVQVSWSEHPDQNVTQYLIWRKTKTASPSMVATRNRGTTSWTDPTYTISIGPNAHLVFYDVRSYYAPNGSTSDQNWNSVQAESGGREASVLGENPRTVDQLNMPQTFRITTYPNPFNPTTTFSYELPQDAFVALEIYDLMGRKLVTLLEGHQSAGYHSTTWNGTEYASGAYLYRFAASPADGKEPFLSTGRLVLTK